MAKTVAIGIQDFEEIIEKECFYIDKTSFIKEWWENRDSVTLITRPRRFGKTLTMSMTEKFFSVKYAGRSELFKGLSIWEEEGYRELQGTYPVIFLSFADVKANTFEGARGSIVLKLIKLFQMHSYLKTSEVLGEDDLEYIKSVKMDMPDYVASVSITYLSEYLYRYYGKKVIILLDEYDTPMQEAYRYGYWDGLISFMRVLFNAAFKSNPYMERAVMTGITRVSKESMFSDLNNLEVVTMTSEKYESAFGFTEEEVFHALDGYGLSGKKQEVKQWYDGFIFGRAANIYNPWSVINFLRKGKFDLYWVNTSSNTLVSDLIRKSDPEVKVAMEDLLRGKPLETEIDEQVVFNELDYGNGAIWSLLLASGYLKVIHAGMDESFNMGYSLQLTNREVYIMFRRMFRGWFARPNVPYNAFIKAFLRKDLEEMNHYMNKIALNSFSFFDSGNAPSAEKEPERFYHGFVLGLVADLAAKYHITSNRESGLGRYDVLVEPLDKKGEAFILEFKVHNAKDENSLEDTVDAALSQIQEKGYDAGLLARGFRKGQIIHYGFAFQGKKVLIGMDNHINPV